MEIRPFVPHLYPTLVSWWLNHDWPSIPLNYLPKTGVVIYGKEVPVCAGFLYSTDSDVAIIEWIISNPHTAKLERRAALVLLIEALCQEAKNRGFKSVFTFASHPRLIEELDSAGFVVTDRGMTHMLKVVSQ